MFKADLIENSLYYKIRRNYLLVTLIAAIPYGVLYTYFQKDINWIFYLLLVSVIVLFILLLIMAKKLKENVGKKLIEIDNETIKITSSEKSTNEVIDIDSVDKLIVKSEYSIAGENFSYLGNEIIGKPLKNYIIVKSKDSKRKLEFEINSYYMIEQLKKLILQWKERGVNIELA